MEKKKMKDTKKDIRKTIPVKEEVPKQEEGLKGKTVKVVVGYLCKTLNLNGTLQSMSRGFTVFTCDNKFQEYPYFMTINEVDYIIINTTRYHSDSIEDVEHSGAILDKLPQVLLEAIYVPTVCFNQTVRTFCTENNAGEVVEGNWEEVLDGICTTLKVMRIR